MSDLIERDDALDPQDAALLAWLGGVLAAVDPEPEVLRELGRAAFSVRRVDEELAELVADSALLGGMVRSVTPGPRLLSFAAGNLVLELQVTDMPRGRAALGMLDGLLEAGPVPADARVDLETADARVESTDVDEVGRFAFDQVPEGLVRLRVVSGALDVTTAWVRLDSAFRHPTP
jgi:hypothetical protein